MKLFWTLGLLLIGGSVPALNNSAAPLASARAAAPEQDAGSNDLGALRRRVRELEQALDQLDGQAELQRMEHELEARRNARMAIRERELALENLSYERNDAEEEVQRQLEERERERERIDNSFEVDFELAQDELEATLQGQREQIENDYEAQRDDLKSQGAGREALRQLEAQFQAQLEDLRTLERTERQNLQEQRRQRQDEAMLFEAHMADVDRSGRQRLRELERAMAQAEFELDVFREEAEAESEIICMRAELERNERARQLELEIEMLNERICLLEEAEEDHEGRFFGAFVDGSAEDSSGAHDSESLDLESVHQALIHLQQQIDELKAEVKNLWKAIEKDKTVQGPPLGLETRDARKLAHPGDR